MVQGKENRRRLHYIIETVILCGRQNIHLQGHRDDGKLTGEEQLANYGNFWTLLHYRSSAGDELLNTYLETASSKATYKSTQNKVVECSEEDIHNVIQSKARNAGLYIHNVGRREEDFLAIVDAYDSIHKEDAENDEQSLIGVALGHCVVELLKHLNLLQKTVLGLAQITALSWFQKKREQFKRSSKIVPKQRDALVSTIHLTILF
ncbi:hypothetical protein PR048_018294 [Dryococelus australis]|uniref:DUF4371 domain-containing protein n=1 Tax=Dryococelus australis TaxID=614101 RepID=A0ABQ9HBY7_9NEOP|nr:hypothetical protein PR048_018294 [Dryococelus australis]